MSRVTVTLVRVPAGSTSCPRRLVPVPDVRRGPPGDPGDSSPCLKDRGVDQHSLATRACVRGPEGSTSSSGHLALGFQDPRGRPDILGNLGPVPSARRVDQVTKIPRARDLGGQPDVPGDSGPAPRACGVDQLSRVTRACVHGPAGSTSCSRRLGPGSEGPRGRSALPGDSGQDPRPRGSTRCPGRLWRGSESLQDRPGQLV